MYSPDELHGLNALLPACATDDANSLTATNTIHVEHLTEAVEKIIRDGADVISTTGSYGECYTLSFEEFQTLVVATLEAVRDRVPLFIGISSGDARETVRKATFARAVGAKGVFVGVPHYYPPTVPNAVAFYNQFAELFPDLSIALYHQPIAHRVFLPIDAIGEISKNQNVVSMKDSHRTPLEFIAMQKIIKGKISVFVNQNQYYPYAQWGARGFWSSDAFMGPWPLVYYRDLVDAGEWEKAEEVLFDMLGGNPGRGGEGSDARPADNVRKLGASYAGYTKQGPNRPPYSVVSPESLERAIKNAERWRDMAEKYRLIVEAREPARS